MTYLSRSAQVFSYFIEWKPTATALLTGCLASLCSAILASLVGRYWWWLRFYLVQNGYPRRGSHIITSFRYLSNASLFLGQTLQPHVEQPGSGTLFTMSLHNQSMVKMDKSTDFQDAGIKHGSEWIDFENIRGWMQKCDETHHIPAVSKPHISIFGPLSQQAPPPRRCGNAEDKQPKRPLWLIDVHRLCLVDGRQSQKYAALSYVWGQAQCFKTLQNNIETLQMDGAFDDSSSTVLLPKTIRHAIHITLLLGIEALWVDALCIIQDDQDKKSAELHGMGAIYSGATVTLIAAVGTDADAGLPGIAGVSGPREPHSGSQNLVRSSEWNKRGWTFQELAFSRRRLIFTPTDVIWECSGMMWRECWGHPYFFDGSFTPLTSPWVTTWQNPDTDALFQYGEMVEGYSRRQLTYPEDVLDAFTGVFVSLSQRLESGFVCGLPTRELSLALLWQPTAREPRPRRRMRQLGSVLVPYLPSWTWAGWEGTIEYDLLKYNCYRGEHDKTGSNDCECMVIHNCSILYGDRAGMRLGQSQIFKRHRRRSRRQPQWQPQRRPRSYLDIDLSKPELPPEVTILPEDAAESKMGVHLDVSPLLCFRTSRRSFRVSSGQSELRPQSPSSFYITDRENWRCGELPMGWLQEANGSNEFHEFVAISKRIKNCKMKEGLEISDDDWSDREKSVSMSKWDDGPVYDVMLIEWTDRIAYRKALGWVTGTAWESGELDMVDVWLG